MSTRPRSPKRDTASPSLPAAYTQLHRQFGWKVPTRFNIAAVCCQRWALAPGSAQRVAIRSYQEDGSTRAHSYAQLQSAANRLSNALRAQGVQRGDRVAIVMPQCFETAVAYIAVLQMGAVAMPLSLLFGPEALAFRLQDSEAVLAICTDAALAPLQAVQSQCPQLRSICSAQAPAHSARFAPVSTLADEPAVLIYTSGTTGNPKGALIAHRSLIGNLTGFVCSQNWFGFDPQGPSPAAGALPQGSQAVFWSPADWAWTGGLMDALLPTLYFGREIVAYSGRFSPEVALQLMARCAVTHTFLFPTALKAMMKAAPGAPGRTVRRAYGLRLQAIMSAGEAVGDAVFAYCQKQLGVTVNEMFGQTEINYIVGNCARIWPPKPGSMGMGYPGHRVAVIDQAGQECPVGEPGDVALHRLDVHGQPNPIFFLGYWKNPAATQAKGYLWYQGRSDDVFKSAGYRIGPGEIENCLVKHPAVANAAVVPKPDPDRGALVKAYVVIAPEYLAVHGARGRRTRALEASLTRALQAHVRGLLAPYEYPKEVEFVDALPMTTTGKVQRRVLRLQEAARAASA